jgi:tetratricopeptide (TPR) repeat protein
MNWIKIQLSNQNSLRQPFPSQDAAFRGRVGSQKGNGFGRVIAGKTYLTALTSLCLGIAFSAPVRAVSISEADQFLLENHYKQAEEAYRSLLDDDQAGDASAGLAVALAKQSLPSKILEAEKILKQARNKFTNNPNVLAAGGYVSFIHSKAVASPAKRDLYLEASESLCKRAIKENPQIFIAQQTLGLVKIAQDDVDGAIDPLRQAATLAENPLNLCLLADALLRSDPKNEEAETLVTKAISLKSDYPQAHLLEAMILSPKGKMEEAFMELNEIPESARNAEWNLIKGDICRKQGDGPLALAAWQEAIRLDPRNADPYRRLAEYYTLRGDGELAIAELHNALEILPNDMLLRNQLAELALRLDKLDVAEAEYRTILASQPDDPHGLLGLARVGFRKARKDGQYPPGWQKLIEQLQNVVTDESVKGQLVKTGAKNLQESIELSEGEKSLAQNHFQEARRHFSAVINNHKDDPYELLTLGDQAYYDGDLSSAEQAFAYAKELPEVAPRAEQGMSKITSQRNDAARHTELGDAFLRKQMPEVALDYYKQALIADPQNANAYYGLYCLYTRSDQADSDKAIKYAVCFLEAADENNELRREVETNMLKLKNHIGKQRRK